MPVPHYRRYLWQLAAPIALLCALCVGLSLWLQPLSNDLTRLGAYAENDYGWNGEQLAFWPALAAMGALTQSYDVVVVGDSFSAPASHVPGTPSVGPGLFWTDFFVQRTGLSLGAFHRQRVSPEEYLASEAFRDHPPKLLVLEVVERELYTLPVAPALCGATARGPIFRPAMHRLAAEPIGFRRDTSRRLTAGQIDAAMDYLKKTVQRWLTGHDQSDVRRFQMSRSDLFSSHRPQNLLVYEYDFQKSTLSAEYLRSLGCALKNFQSRVVANGQTAFVLVIAPDRSTAYAEFTPGLHLPNLSEQLAADAGLNLLRLDISLKRAIAAGIKDVYLPDDTHWATAGKQIAADSLVKYLQGGASAESAGP